MTRDERDVAIVLPIFWSEYIETNVSAAIQLMHYRPPQLRYRVTYLPRSVAGDEAMQLTDHKACKSCGVMIFTSVHKNFFNSKVNMHS